MAQAKVKLSDILEGMDMAGDLSTAYLDTQTGKVVFLDEQETLGLDLDADLDDCSDWEREMVELARAVDADDAGRFLDLPDRFDIDEWRMMRDFAAAAGEHAETLERAIHGRGAFRCFKDRVGELGLADDWYAFRDDQYRQVALDWCEANGVAVDPG